MAMAQHGADLLEGTYIKQCNERRETPSCKQVPLWGTVNGRNDARRPALQLYGQRVMVSSWSGQVPNC